MRVDRAERGSATKIAVVTETFLPFRGGSARRYLEIFKRLSKSGFEIDLYTARLKKEWACDEELDGIHVTRSPKIYGNLITGEGFRDVSQVLNFSLWVAGNLRNSNEYDLFEANHCPIFPAMASWFRSKMRNTKLTITFHEAWHTQWHEYSPSRIYPPLGIVLEKALTWLPDIGIAVSRFTAERLARFYGMDLSKIQVIPNGIDGELIRRVDAKRNGHRIVYVGRLNPHKKVEWLIEAFGLLKKECPGAELEIIGDGPMYGTYAEYVRKMHVEDISFKRNVGDEEIIESLKSSRVYVLPSIREGQSITTLEAMASGTPQIVVEAEGNAAAEMVNEGQSGVCVRPSVKKICRAMRTLLEDDEAWRRLSENGIKYASDLNWESIAQHHAKLYQSLAYQ